VSGGRSKSPKVSADINNNMSNVANSALAENLSVLSTSSKSPETRRRAAALKFARESTDIVDPRSELSPALNSPSGVGEIGVNDVQTTPTQEIPGNFADNIALAISPGSGQALERKPASAGVLSSATRLARANACYPGLVAVSSGPTDPGIYPRSVFSTHKNANFFVFHCTMMRLGAFGCASNSTLNIFFSLKAVT